MKCVEHFVKLFEKNMLHTPHLPLVIMALQQSCLLVQKIKKNGTKSHACGMAAGFWLIILAPFSEEIYLINFVLKNIYVCTYYIYIYVYIIIYAKIDQAYLLLN